MKTPKRILLVITKSNWGGAQSYVYTLASKLYANGNDVAVALGGTGMPDASTGALAERLTEKGIRIVHLKAMTRDLSVTRELHALRELYSTIRAERPDVLHLNSSKAGVLGSFIGRLSGIPSIVFTAHGWPHREPRPFLMRALIWAASWLTVAFSTATIVVSRKDYQDTPIFFSRRKIHMIHNGMDPFPLVSCDEARSALLKNAAYVPSQDYWFLMNAELHPNKAIDVAIEAFKSYAAHTVDTALVIVSDGQERPALEKQIATSGVADRIVLAGFVPNARTYMRAGNAFLLPSRKEGFPLVLLEAGLAHVPVIASRTGGIPEIIEDGRTGILIRTADKTELAAAMSHVHDNADSAIDLADALYKKVIEDFSESQMIEKTFALYSR